jgi:hypothetical protein
LFYFCHLKINITTKNKNTMKKLYSLLIFSVAVASASFGQTISSGYVGTPVSAAVLKHGTPSVMSPDTLMPPSFGMPVQCDSAPKLYNWQAPASGYVFGNSSYGEIECAQKYYGNGTVDEVLVWIGYTTGATGSTTAKIYTIDPTTKGPSSTVSGTSLPVLISAISTSALTSYSFAPTVAVTNEFACALVFPTTTGDTVAVVSTAIGCATADSLSWMNFPAFGGWLATVQAIQGNPNADLYIMPVGTLVGSATGVNEYSANGLALTGAYPNPANEFTNITYRIDEASSVNVNVFDLTGRVVLNSTEQLSKGTHEIKVSLKNVPAGNYYYTVTTATSKLTSKFSVVK